MKTTRYAIAIIFSALFLSIGSGIRADVVSEGKRIIEKADRVLYPEEGTYILSITARFEGRDLEYTMEGYKKGTERQTIVMTKPTVQKGDVGIRRNETIYWKPKKWHKAQIMSYQAVFLESPMSYGDILSSDLNKDYLAAKVEKSNYEGKEVYNIQLKPTRSGLYARMDMVIDANNYRTYKRTYYTASGDILKTAVYSDYTGEGMTASFKIVIDHKFQQLIGEAYVTDIKKGTFPGFMVDPNSINRIRPR